MLLKHLLVGLVGTALILWAIAVLVATASVVADAHSKMERDETVVNDFPIFYAGARGVTADDREHVYEAATIKETILSLWVDRDSETAQKMFPLFQYLNPPFYLFALSPLTQLDIEDAYLVTVAINCGLLGLLLLLSGTILKWRQPATLFFGLCSLGFMAVPTSVYNAHPSILLAVLLMSAFILAQRGRTLIASLLVAFIAVKPQWALATGVSLVRHTPRASLPLVIFGAALVFLPFVLLGADALVDYVRLLRARGSDDLSNPDFARHALSWAGFLFAITGSTQAVASTLLSVASVAVFAVIWRRGDPSLTWTASILVVLIALPHSQPQDWILTVPAAAILLARPTTAPLRTWTAVLLSVGFAAANSTLVSREIVQDGGTAVYFGTLMAATLLVWCAALPLLERWLRTSSEDLSARAPLSAPATFS